MACGQRRQVQRLRISFFSPSDKPSSPFYLQAAIESDDAYYCILRLLCSEDLNLWQQVDNCLYAFAFMQQAGLGGSSDTGSTVLLSGGLWELF